jgi:nucleotide-binding universal stress UspA family protein
MFERVLFPTDFSAYANAVASCLPSFQTAGVKEVILLHVVRASDVPLPESYNLQSYKYIRWSAEENLNLLRMALEGQGLRVRIRIEYGSPVAEIIRVANEEQVGMIIIGAHGSTLFQELMIGSTAFEVIRQSTVPVLLEKVEVLHEKGHIHCRWTCTEMFQRVLHPTDFSPLADEAYQTLQRMLAAGIKEVVLLHVQDERVLKHRTTEQIADFDHQDQVRLKERCGHLSDLGFKTRWILRHGNPAQVTLQVAKEIKAGSLILGSQGKSAIRELLTGSTLDHIVRLTELPVLIVKSPKPDLPSE